MRSQAILLAVPSIAMTVVGFALFGPGSTRPFDGGQIWGGPVVGRRRLTLRVAVIERLHGVDSMHAIGDLLVRVRDGDGAPAAVRCTTRSDATCDVVLDFDHETRGPLLATVSTENELEPLAAGEIAAPSEWGGATRPARLIGQSRGDLEVALYARRGIFAAPFRDELVAEVKRNGAPVPGARITFRADAAELDGGLPDGSARVVADASGGAVIGLKPLTHTLEVSATAEGPAAATGTFDGILPVVAGAMWLDPAAALAGTLRVVSPVPRELAYLSLATASERLWGGTVPLHVDSLGFASGAIDWPAEASDARSPVWLTLSSDPRGSGAGTVGWPLARRGTDPQPSARDERAFRDKLLLDGMPLAEQRDGARRRRARTLSAVALGAAAVLEGILLADTTRQKGERSWGRFAVAIATIVLAFAAIEVVVMWKTGG
jgi:hypothetical protein